VFCVSYDIAVDSHFLRWSYDNELCKSKSVYRMKQWTFVVSIDLYAYNVFVRMCVTMRNDSSINASLRSYWYVFNSNEIHVNEHVSTQVYTYAWKDSSMENGSEMLLLLLLNRTISRQPVVDLAIEYIFVILRNLQIYIKLFYKRDWYIYRFFRVTLLYIIGFINFWAVDS